MNAQTSIKHAASACELQALGLCKRNAYEASFLWDRNRTESVSVCVHCDSRGFIPLGPQPGLDFIHRR